MKTLILDTNVLLTDPDSLYAFEENEIILPFTTIEELDKIKSRTNEVGANAREVARRLSEMISENEQGALKRGVKLPSGGTLRLVAVSDFIFDEDEKFGKDWDPTNKDNHILDVCRGLTKQHREEGKPDPVLISRDILLRVKCDFLGIPCEDYKNSHVTDNVDSIYTGSTLLDVEEEEIQEFWECSQDVTKDFYLKLDPEFEQELVPNQFLLLQDPNSDDEPAVRYIDTGEPFKVVHDIKAPVYGLLPRNKEQNLAMDLLLDQDIKLVTLLGLAGCGKAQPLSAKILTPHGWTTMGEVYVGQEIIGKSGGKTKILGKFPQGEKDIYEITFSDGSKTRTCKEHLWETSSEHERTRNTSSVKTLEEIMHSLRGHDGRKNHSIPIVGEVQFEGRPWSLHPYLLGVLLGDGCMALPNRVTFTNADQEIIEKIKCLLPENTEINKKPNSKYDYTFKQTKKTNKQNEIVKQIQNLKLAGKKSYEKYIPDVYKYGTIETRKQLLQGLVDTDGYICNAGTNAEFYTTSAQLALDVKEIVSSLGGVATLSKKQTKYSYLGEKKDGRPSWVVRFSFVTNFCPASISRKTSKWKTKRKYITRKYIVKVEHVGKEKAQCILVDAKDHLYVTDDYVVTHNTLLALAAGLNQVIEKKRYKRLFICRPIVPVGNDIGFLPGEKSEKLEPWIAPIKDNLRYLLFSGTAGRKSRQNELTFNNFFEDGLIEIEAITYLRGRSIADAYVIIDEAQNLTAHELKTIITRVGENTKIVLTGDIDQIDNMYIDAKSNGLTIAVEKFKKHKIAGHIKLVKGERSELATLASALL